MPAVADAWARYLAAAAAAELDIAANFTAAPSPEVVAEAFRSERLDAGEDLIEYFGVLWELAEHGGDRIFIGEWALGLGEAILEHRQLTEFAVEAAEEGDPELVYASTRFPLTTGKPTTMVDRRSGQVFAQWWDEPEPRVIAESLDEWLDQRTAELQAGGPDVEHFARTLAGTASIRIGGYDFGPAQFWLRKASVHVSVHGCTRVVVRYLPVGSTPESLDLERTQAELVADLLVGVGVPRPAISFQVDDPSDRRAGLRGMHSVWLDGYR